MAFDHNDENADPDATLQCIALYLDVLDNERETFAGKLELWREGEQELKAFKIRRQEILVVVFRGKISRTSDRSGCSTEVDLMMFLMEILVVFLVAFLVVVLVVVFMDDGVLDNVLNVVFLQCSGCCFCGDIDIYDSI